VRRSVVTVAAVIATLGFILIGVSAAQTTSSAPRATAGRIWIAPLHGNRYGNLDCNAQSTIESPLKRPLACADIRGFVSEHNANTWGGRFYDNGVYIGHDEPDIRYLSNKPGSGNDATWTVTLPKDPAAAPTTSPLPKSSVVTHEVELTPAIWFSMALCNPYSYPLLPCTPESNANAPKCLTFVCKAGQYPGAGSSVTEFQFYPPGEAPFPDNISCNNKYWCASMAIFDLECSYAFTACNPGCEEPYNFSFIQRNGVPTGPPSPQLSDLKSELPNAETLMMSPGDTLKVSLFDAAVPGEKGQRALIERIRDLTTGQTGYMQASAKNGFMATNEASCAGTPFNYQPEYSTAAAGNVSPWAADQIDISEAVETGHFETCTSLKQPFGFSEPGFFDVIWNKCVGGIEVAGGDEGAETGDAICYPAGDTHFGKAPPNVVTGCEDNYFQNGDLDFDGEPYWRFWPDSTTPNHFPSTFLESPPTTVGGAPYQKFQFQTDIPLSETSCAFPKTGGCKVPPPQSVGIGDFYPYYTLVGTGSSCVLEFGMMTNGNSFGGDAQYGKIPKGFSYPQLFGPIRKNTCTN
jgi:hypothetical protein